MSAILSFAKTGGCACSSTGYVKSIEAKEADVRKFIFNTSFISAIFGGWGAIQSTRRGPRDWRLALLWISWGLSVAIAVGTVVKEANGRPEELED